MSSASRRNGGRQGKGTLARYTDPHGRRHRVVLRGRLLLDLCPADMPRLVARLEDDEGEAQARALLDGSVIDEGYLERMRREPRAICRALTPDDVAPRADRETVSNRGGWVASPVAA